MLTCGDREKKKLKFLSSRASSTQIQDISLLIGGERLGNVQKMNERAKRASYCFSMLNMQICATVLVVVASLPILC